jgi:hypothetical protein
MMTRLAAVIGLLIVIMMTPLVIVCSVFAEAFGDGQKTAREWIASFARDMWANLYRPCILAILGRDDT